MGARFIHIYIYIYISKLLAWHRIEPITAISLEVAWVLRHLIALKFDKHIGSNVAVESVQFQNDRKNLNPYFAALRLVRTRHLAPNGNRPLSD